MHSSTRWVYTLLLFIFCLQAASAQNITRSPYSIVGAGDLIFGGNVSSLSMGRVNQGIRRPFEVNWLNPASYSSLQQTNIETGAMFSNASFTGNGQTSNANNAWLAYLNIAMPISAKKGVGFSFGLAPFTSIGYNVSAAGSIPSDSAAIPVTNNFIGTGGLSKAYLGGGLRLYKNLSLGANLGFIFGQVDQKAQLVIPASYRMFNMEERRNTYMSGFVYDIGLQYHHTFKNEITFAAGASITPKATLNGIEDYVVRTLPIGFTGGTKDTIINRKEVEGSIILPMAWSTGFSLSKPNHWLIAADVYGANWKDFRAYNRTDSLQNSLGFSLGGSYIPNFAAPKNILNRLEYRAGFGYAQTNWQFFGQSVNALTLSCGVGIPLTKSKSKVSVGFEYSRRGTSANNLIQEDFYRFIIGVSFSDKWFYRYRYD